MSAETPPPETEEDAERPVSPERDASDATGPESSGDAPAANAAESVGTPEPAPEPQELDPPEAAPALPLEEACASVEALLYASADPLNLAAMKKALREAPELVPQALSALRERYGEDGRGLQLIEVAGGWQITTRPEYHERVARLFQAPRPTRLSIQALETLAVIAYRQPATVPEIVELRGVRSAGVVRTLLERKLIKILGRKKVVGHPLLYGTTKEFLVRFGLKNLKELPQLRDMSEVFGDEVAQHLEVLETLDRNKEVVEIEPLPDPAAESESPAAPEESPEVDESDDASRPTPEGVE